MPVPGLSLVGFMEQAQARNHLRQACVPADPSDVALDIEWQKARDQLGPPMPNAGQPELLPLAANDLQHVHTILTDPALMQAFQPGGAMFGSAFHWVEIRPLLAYQHSVMLDRSNHHGAGLTKPPTESELMAMCLPPKIPDEPFQAVLGPQSALIRSPSLNLRVLAQGVFNASFSGIGFGPALPFVHVVRLNGRCYLHNGFHRAYCAGIAGATHLPCAFRDVATPDDAGIRYDGGTFPLSLLESQNPPTVGHYLDNRAHPVQLRRVSRVLHVSWADYIVSEE